MAKSTQTAAADIEHYSNMVVGTLRVSLFEDDGTRSVPTTMQRLNNPDTNTRNVI